MMLVCTGGSCEVGLLYCDTGGIHDMEMDNFDFCDNLKSPGLDCRAWTIITIYTCEDINLTKSTIQLRVVTLQNRQLMLCLTLVSSVFAC